MLPGSTASAQCVPLGMFGPGRENVDARIEPADEEREGKDGVECGVKSMVLAGARVLVSGADGWPGVGMGARSVSGVN